ncbi:hypothetical protein JCM18918_2943 [Cutibacterium acnes JCM 18918]|nr:hypothetical protein JCM18918_2943 [Cutibacterium acnes JCM 18918]
MSALPAIAYFFVGLLAGRQRNEREAGGTGRSPTLPGRSAWDGLLRPPSVVCWR